LRVSRCKLHHARANRRTRNRLATNQTIDATMAANPKAWMEIWFASSAVVGLGTGRAIGAVGVSDSIVCARMFSGAIAMSSCGSNSAAADVKVGSKLEPMAVSKRLGVSMSTIGVAATGIGSGSLTSSTNSDLSHAAGIPIDQPVNPEAERASVASGHAKIAIRVVRYTTDCTADPRDLSIQPTSKPIEIRIVDCNSQLVANPTDADDASMRKV